MLIFFYLTFDSSDSYLGYRFFKRGVNEDGHVANDVETEQIVFEETQDEIPCEITSVVQRRGSIPLFWSQETTKCPIKPEILCKFLIMSTVNFFFLYTICY